jgi:hypothetical protein
MPAHPGSTPTRNWPSGGRAGTAVHPQPGSPRRKPGSRQRAIPITAGPGRPWADAQPVRDHVARLRQGGGSYDAIAAAAGVATMTVHAIACGHGRITTATAMALLAVDPAGVRRVRVDAGGTRLRLRALHVMGHDCARISRATRTSGQALQKITRGDTATVSPRLRDAVTAVYDAWWDKRAPARTRTERAAAAAARRRAQAGNWCAAAALDDDQLDVPGYRPDQRWRPATGTGTATSIHLSSPHQQAGIA